MGADKKGSSPRHGGLDRCNRNGNPHCSVSLHTVIDERACKIQSRPLGHLCLLHQYPSLRYHEYLGQGITRGNGRGKNNDIPISTCLIIVMTFLVSCKRAWYLFRK